MTWPTTRHVAVRRNQTRFAAGAPMGRIVTLASACVIVAACGGGADHVVSTATSSSIRATTAPVATTTMSDEPTTSGSVPGVWAFGQVVAADVPGSGSEAEWFAVPVDGIAGTGRQVVVDGGEWGDTWWEFPIGGTLRWIPDAFVVFAEPIPSGAFRVRAAPEPVGALAPDMYAVFARDAPTGRVLVSLSPSEPLGAVVLAVRDADGMIHYRMGGIGGASWLRSIDVEPDGVLPPPDRMFLQEGWVTLDDASDGFMGAVRVVDGGGASVSGATVTLSILVEPPGSTYPAVVDTDGDGWARLVIDVRPESASWVSMDVQSVAHPGLEFVVPSGAGSDGARRLFGWMSGCCEPEFPMLGEFGGPSVTLCPVGIEAEVRASWDRRSPPIATIPQSGVATAGGGVMSGSGGLWLRVVLGHEVGFVDASSVRHCEPDPFCSAGWVRPEPWQRLSREPFDALREFYGLEGDDTFVASAIQYFVSPGSLVDTGGLRLGAIGFWYVEGWLESDALFRGRWILVDLELDNALGRDAVPVAAAAFSSDGYEPGTWVGLLSMSVGRPRVGTVAIPGLPGLYPDRPTRDPFDSTDAPLLAPGILGCLR